MDDRMSTVSTSEDLMKPKVKSRRHTQYAAAVSVTLGAFALGNVLAWTSPAQGTLEKSYSPVEISWIGATMTIGAAASVIPVGYLLDKVGRKLTMLGLVFPFVVGWLFIIFAECVVLIVIGRFIVGMSGGAFSLSAPAYTSEISEDEIRGMLGSFFQLMVTVGILFVYIVGSQVKLVWLSVVCGLVPVVFGVIFSFMPETPLYYLRQGREEEACKSLQWFRGPGYDIQPELNGIKESVAQSETEKVSYFHAFSTKAAKKGLVVAFGLMLFQQLSGVNAVIFYAATIFQDAGSHVDASIATIIVGIVQMVATFVSSMVVDRVGRRVLLLVSDTVMAVCTLLLGIFFFLKDSGHDVTHLGWMPLASLCIFIIVFSLGYGPIPWMMVGELFPPEIKGAASSIACMFNWLLAFLVTKFYSDLKDSFGSDVTFWIFTVISIFGAIFVFLIVPETKGKSLEQIQRVLGSFVLIPEEPIVAVVRVS